MIKNPIGKKKSLGNGYFYQVIRLPVVRGFSKGYVKVWHHDQVIDRALNVTSARAMAKRHAQKGLFDD